MPVASRDSIAMFFTLVIVVYIMCVFGHVCAMVLVWSFHITQAVNSQRS